MGDKPDPDAVGKVMEGGKRQAEADLSATDRETRKKTKVEYSDPKAAVKEGDGSDDDIKEIPMTTKVADSKDDLLGLPVEPTGLEGAAFQSRVPNDKMTQVE